MKAIPPLLGAPKGQWPKRSTPETQPRVIPLARKVAKEHPDVLGAQARADVLTERWRELATRVATTPAKTPEGLVAKLAMIAPAYADDAHECTYDGILASAALDVQALALKAGEART
jgi:hypothetical protein